MLKKLLINMAVLIIVPAGVFWWLCAVNIIGAYSHKDSGNCVYFAYIGRPKIWRSSEGSPNFSESKVIRESPATSRNLTLRFDYYHYSINSPEPVLIIDIVGGNNPNNRAAIKELVIGRNECRRDHDLKLPIPAALKPGPYEVRFRIARFEKDGKKILTIQTLPFTITE